MSYRFCPAVPFYRTMFAGQNHQDIFSKLRYFLDHFNFSRCRLWSQKNGHHLILNFEFSTTPKQTFHVQHYWPNVRAPSPMPPTATPLANARFDRAVTWGGSPSPTRSRWAALRPTTGDNPLLTACAIKSPPAQPWEYELTLPSDARTNVGLDWASMYLGDAF